MMEAGGGARVVGGTQGARVFGMFGKFQTCFMSDHCALVCVMFDLSFDFSLL